MQIIARLQWCFSKSPISIDLRHGSPSVDQPFGSSIATSPWKCRLPLSTSRNGVLQSHHPYYWASPRKKPTTSFFPRDISPNQMVRVMQRGLRSNRTRLRQIGDGTAAFRFRAANQTYQIGVDRGRVNQFFPVHR